MAIKKSKNKKMLEYISINILGGFSATELAYLVMQGKGTYTFNEVNAVILNITKYSKIQKIAKDTILSYGMETCDIVVNDNFEEKNKWDEDDPVKYDVDEVVKMVAEHIIMISGNQLTLKI